MRLKNLFFVFSLLLSMLSHAQKDKVDLNEFIAETQISAGDSEEMKIVWWIPLEFWELVMAEDKTLTDTQKEEFLVSLKEIVMFGVVHGSLSSATDITYDSYESIKKSLTLTGQNNKKYKALDEDDLSTEVAVLLAVFKPILKNLMGNMGENFHFFVFDDYQGSKRIADPLAGGKVEVKLFGQTYAWETPMGSLLPKKFCPVDNEPLNGGWKYCPHHGKALVEED